LFDHAKKDYTTWEKFSAKFELESIQVSEMHSYYMTGFYNAKHIARIDFKKDRKMVSHLNSLFNIFCLDTLVRKGSNLILHKLLTIE